MNKRFSLGQYMAAVLDLYSRRIVGWSMEERMENRIRPIELGRQNWLFAGSYRACLRAPAVISLIHSAKLNELDPYVYLRDVLERLPMQPASRIAKLLPHHGS